MCRSDEYMQCWDGQFVCDFSTELVCAGRVMNTELGLTEFVCDCMCSTDLVCKGRVMNIIVLTLKE